MTTITRIISGASTTFVHLVGGRSGRVLRSASQITVVLGSAVFVAQIAACTDPDPADVEWRVAGHVESEDTPQVEAEADGGFIGFYAASQTVDDVSTTRSMWWDGRRFRQYRNEQLITDSMCRGVPLGEGRITLRCELSAGDDDASARPGSGDVVRGPSVVPLQAVGHDQLVHRARPETVYRRAEIPGYLLYLEQDSSTSNQDPAGVN